MVKHAATAFKGSILLLHIHILHCSWVMLQGALQPQHVRGDSAVRDTHAAASTSAACQAMTIAAKRNA